MKIRRSLLVFFLLSIVAYCYLFKIQNVFFPDYKVSKNVIHTILAENIRSDMSDYEKIRAIHNYIVISTKYDIENLKNDTIPDIDYTAKGVLENHIGVCRGYAEAFKLLMDELGIECRILTGIVDDISHAWNVVKIDGQWYQIDCTYDDPVGENNVAGNRDNLRYDYFLITNAQMYLDHIPDSESDVYTCISEEYMYMEKSENVPYTFLDSIMDIPTSLVSYVNHGKRHVTFYFPEGYDLKATNIVDKIAMSLGNTGYSFTKFYYTPVTKCGKYFYTTITVE